jgi:hypothetical protein
VPLYGLSLYRGTHEDRAQLQSEEPIGVGEEFDYLGERWVVRSIEPSELGRVEAWLVCEPAEPPAQLH